MLSENGPNITLNDGNYTQTILTLNIPSAGKWRIDYTIRATIDSHPTNPSAGNGALAALFDSGGTMIPGGAVTIGFIYGSTGIQATASQHKYVTTTGPATYRLRAKSWINSRSVIASDSTGQTKISYLRVGN